MKERKQSYGLDIVLKSFKMPYDKNTLAKNGLDKG
jgi:hypothetical protein